MTQKVPVLSLIFMGVALIVSVAVPVLLLLYFRKRKQADVVPFFVGCAVFVLFALVLEGLCNSLLLVRSPWGETIRNNLWLMALVGGLMAGLFEETGRYVAFRTVLRKWQKKDINALMYGAGHGGMEALVVLGLLSVNNIAYTILINTGRQGEILALLPEVQRAQMEAVFAQLLNTAPGLFLLSAVERCLAAALHLALSVLVWLAAKKPGKRYLFPAAITLHAAVDAVAVLLGGSGISAVLVEIAVAVMTALAVLFALAVWRRNSSREDE
ncbi:MAG: YhfC family intramembrane metalloprotease [Oscillospiraceae bacterium]|nr:YhfC family intramembrane metalloprotease [Oscillospiraceae bacterium]